MNRRTFLKLPALLPLAQFRVPSRLAGRDFQFEYVIGTSLDLVVWTTFDYTAERTKQIVLGEIDHLASILDTRNPNSEISRFEAGNTGNPSRELKEVLDAYDHWGRRTNGALSIYPGGPDTPRS